MHMVQMVFILNSSTVYMQLGVVGEHGQEVSMTLGHIFFV